MGRFRPIAFAIMKEKRRQTTNERKIKRLFGKRTVRRGRRV